uniref:Uncharacterized protein n=1 Tax=Arundo donax TaxID=35708 RepID=A0A0A8Y5X5_ARUDO
MLVWNNLLNCDVTIIQNGTFWRHSSNRIDLLFICSSA